MSDFTKELLKNITYHNEIASTEICMSNLKKISPMFNSNDIFTLAYLITHPEIPENDKEILKQCLKHRIEMENNKEIFKR